MKRFNQPPEPGTLWAANSYCTLPQSVFFLVTSVRRTGRWFNGGAEWQIGWLRSGSERFEMEHFYTLFEWNRLFRKVSK